MKLTSSPAPDNPNGNTQHIEKSMTGKSFTVPAPSPVQSDEDFTIRLIDGKAEHQHMHRDRYNLIMCLHGSLQYSSGSGHFSLLAGGAYFSGPRRSTYIARHSVDVRYYEISFNEHFISRAILRETMLDKLLDTCGEVPAICYPGEHQLDYILPLFGKLYKEVNTRQVLHKQMLKLLFIETMIELARSDERCANKIYGNIPYRRSGQLHNQFTQLVEKHYMKLRLVQDYADLLSVTGKHLSEVIKKETGQTALSLIHSRLFSEAKFLLCRTEMSVKEIADTLNFDTSSHFGRFIKQFSGYSPSDYRNIQCALL